MRASHICDECRLPVLAVRVDDGSEVVIGPTPDRGGRVWVSGHHGPDKPVVTIETSPEDVPPNVVFRYSLHPCPPF